jgi:outer membrane PBP1 activator LpoA protein
LKVLLIAFMLTGCSGSLQWGQPTVVQVAPPADNDTVLERLQQAEATRLAIRQLSR